MARKIFTRTNWKYSLFDTFVLSFILIVILRLFQIQVLNSSRYKAQAYEQQWQGFEIQARRGEIETSDKYKIVRNSTAFEAYINKSKVSEDEKKFMAKELQMKSRDFEEYLTASSGKYVKLPNTFSYQQKKQFEETGFLNIEFLETYTRFYPEGQMLAHLLGFVGKNKSNVSVGYYGLEQYYNGDLQGKNGWALEERSASGYPIIWGGSEKIDPINGGNLTLTIDRVVQFIIEESLDEGVKKYGAKSGTIIVVDPHKGSILAMASSPTYDPSNYAEFFSDDQILVRNPAISAIYEPGSVMKAMTVASGLDSGKIAIDSVYNDTGPRVYSGYIVDNWDGKHHAEETITEILQHSNNLGAAWVGQKTGGELLMKYFTNFGFGKATGIDLEGEEAGVIYDDFPLKDIELVNAAFGQGIAVTPLQIVMAFSTIANGGNLMKPYVVEKLTSDEKEILISPKEIRKVITPKTSETLVQLLTEAVSGGEAKYFVLKQYKVAGKTGTAQIATSKGYDETRTNATFVGFFPSYKNFVMLVKLEEPSAPSGYAAETAVPLWMKIASDLSSYYGMAPDRN